MEHELRLLTNNNSTQYYKEVVEMNGYNILNNIDENKRTRIANTRKTIIHHVVLRVHNFTNKIEKNMILQDLHFSDHKSIIVEYKIYSQENNQKFKNPENIHR